MNSSRQQQQQHYSFDPYSPSIIKKEPYPVVIPSKPCALLDEVLLEDDATPSRHHQRQPLSAESDHVLEMEDDDEESMSMIAGSTTSRGSRSGTRIGTSRSPVDHAGMTTSSGLLLTHRRVATAAATAAAASVQSSPVGGRSPSTAFRPEDEDDDDDYYYDFYGGKKRSGGGPQWNSPQSRSPSHNHQQQHPLPQQMPQQQKQPRTAYPLPRARLEVENPWSAHHRHTPEFQIQKLFSYARVGVVLSSLVLILGTAILLHHARTTISAEEKSAYHTTTNPQNGGDGELVVVTVATTPSQQQQHQYRVVQWEDTNLYNNALSDETSPDQIVFLPLDPSLPRTTPKDAASSWRSSTAVVSSSSSHSPINNNQESQFDRHLYHGWQRKLKTLRAAFESWIRQNGKQYNTDEEVDFRFQVWMENHHRIMEKNDRHGPCRLTKEPVFGSNHFQDLTKEEFEDQFLNAKHVPLSQKLRPRKLSSGTMGVHVSPTVNRHPKVHSRFLQMIGQELQQDELSEGEEESPIRQRAKNYNCGWFDIACMVRWVVERYFYGFYGIGKTLEPAYDSNTYPKVRVTAFVVLMLDLLAPFGLTHATTIFAPIPPKKAVDWRTVGAITDIRSQDNCGACWAITAVECVESATFLADGTLYDLAEYEPILCVEDSEMCYGGWPENAFDYILEHGGVPLEKYLPYNADFLLALTQAKTGESSSMT